MHVAAAVAWSQHFLTYTKMLQTGQEKQGGRGKAGGAGQRHTSCRVQQSYGVLDARADPGCTDKGIYGEQQFVSWLIHCHLYSGPCRHHRGSWRSYRREPLWEARGKLVGEALREALRKGLRGGPVGALRAAPIRAHIRAALRGVQGRPGAAVRAAREDRFRGWR